MAYLRRKVVFCLVAAWAAITLNFLIPRLIPGNPVDILLSKMNAAGGTVTPETRDSIALLLGYDRDQGLWSQYVGYLSNLAHGDLGRSVTFFPTPVATVVSQALPWTVALVGIATALSFAFGIVLGVLVGWKRGTWLDSLVPSTAFLSAIPYFWLALVLVFCFAMIVPIFPLSGVYAFGEQVGGTRDS